MSQPDQEPAREAPDGDELARIGPGARLGRYRIVRRLGAGGMGADYEAIHTGLDKRVALKTLHPSIAQSDRAVRRFKREGEATSRIRHPHVVDVTDVAGAGAGRTPSSRSTPSTPGQASPSAGSARSAARRTTAR